MENTQIFEAIADRLDDMTKCYAEAQRVKGIIGIVGDVIVIGSLMTMLLSVILAILVDCPMLIIIGLVIGIIAWAIGMLLTSTSGTSKIMRIIAPEYSGLKELITDIRGD